MKWFFHQASTLNIFNLVVWGFRAVIFQLPFFAVLNTPILVGHKVHMPGTNGIFTYMKTHENQPSPRDPITLSDDGWGV